MTGQGEVYGKVGLERSIQCCSKNMCKINQIEKKLSKKLFHFQIHHCSFIDFIKKFLKKATFCFHARSRKNLAWFKWIWNPTGHRKMTSGLVLLFLLSAASERAALEPIFQMVVWLVNMHQIVLVPVNSYEIINYKTSRALCSAGKPLLDEIKNIGWELVCSCWSKTLKDAPPGA